MITKAHPKEPDPDYILDGSAWLEVGAFTLWIHTIPSGDVWIDVFERGKEAEEEVAFFRLPISLVEGPVTFNPAGPPFFGPRAGGG